MVVTNKMADFLFSFKPTSGNSSRNYSDNNSSYSQFKSILDSKSASHQNDSKATKTNSASEKQPSAKKEELLVNCTNKRTFRDIAENRNEVEQKQSCDSSEVSGNQNGSGEVAASGKQSKTDKTKGEVIMDAVAQVLGLTPAELTKLLDSMKIKAEDLADKTKLDGIVSKLTGMLGLNKDQENALSSLLSSASEITQSLLTQYSNDKTSKESVQASENQPVQSEADQEQYAGTKVPNVEIEDITEVMAKFKTKLSQLAQELQNNPHNVENEISEKIESVLQSKQESADPESVQTAKNDSDSGKDKVLDEGKKNILDFNKKTVSSAGKDEAKIIPADSKASDNGNQAQQNGNGNNTDMDFNQFKIASVNQVVKADSLISSDKAQSNVTVSQKDILTQVIDKAKIILNGDKTEMSMDLKPESLGKLSLKVVTERGIVTAKFIAENQQVKETLEANMQLLKDSLQKQGLTVQNCSVSVGQESFYGFNRDNGFGKNEKAAGNKAGASSGIGVEVADIPENPSVANPYEWSDSSINLTA